MQTKSRYSYLELIEDNKDKQTLNLFEKVLVASVRAKDLQQLNSMPDAKHRNPGYTALQELKTHKIFPQELDHAEEKTEEEEI